MLTLNGKEYAVEVLCEVIPCLPGAGIADLYHVITDLVEGFLRVWLATLTNEVDMCLRNSKILITGGTGSFGKSFIRYLLRRFPDIGSIVVYSRDEQKHVAMADEFSPGKYPLQYKIGDVRDRERLMDVCQGIDIVVHSAAIKHVPVAEQNPFESVKTNILGSQNVIDAALANGVRQVVALSTDKAASPVNMYGATKLCLEKLFVYANSAKKTKFSVVRYGNIFGSKGSVVPLFLKKRREGFLPITHPDMTRFSITLQDSIDLVMYALENGLGGEIVVPVAASYKIKDVANAVAAEVEHRVVGIRAGEKLHEILFNENEAVNTVRRGNYYIICSPGNGVSVDDYCLKTGATKIADTMEYHSGNNTTWLTVAQIKNLIATEIGEIA